MKRDCLLAEQVEKSLGYLKRCSYELEFLQLPEKPTELQIIISNPE